jgi:hypothetical protein
MPAGQRRSMADLLQQQRDAAGETVPVLPPSAPRSADAGVISPGSIPEPYSAVSDGKLSGQEQADLGVCETAIDNLRLAFWAAGKALQVIRDGQLYREAYPTFEKYVAARWDMSRAQAYRLIDAWPLAERLSPIGDRRLNQGQVRELLPLADRYGPDAAAVVYGTVTEADDVAVTARLLHDVVGILPDDHFDQDEAVKQIRAYLADGTPRRSAPSANPVNVFTSEATRLRRIATSRRIRAALAADPGAVRQVIAQLRELLDQLESGVTDEAGPPAGEGPAG